MGEDRPGRRPEGGGLADEPEPRRFYGRRRGRPLRPARAALIETALPRFATPDPLAGPIDPAALFSSPKSAYWLELGFGSGEHLIWQAARHPDVGLIGAEPFVGGVAACLAAIEAAGVENVRLHGDDGRPLMDALPAASIARVFVLQPDPWRKRRHWGRRLIGPAGLDALARIIVDDGELRISTDHPGYLAWMLRHIAADDRFHWRADRADDWRVPPADWPETRYAAKAAREGRTVTYLTIRRRPRAA